MGITEQLQTLATARTFTFIKPSLFKKIVESIQDELCVVLCSFHSFCPLFLGSNVETKMYDDKPASEIQIEVRFLSRFLFSCNAGSSLLLEWWDNSLSEC